MDLLTVGLVLLWLVAGLSVWCGYQLLVQFGRALQRLEAIEADRAGLRVAVEAASGAGRLACPSTVTGDSEQPGLPAGSLVVDFELPDLAGGRRTRSHWLGRSLLLIFVDPTCPFSRLLLRDLAVLEPDPQDRTPVPVILSTGGLEPNRRLVERFGLQCTVLLQEQREVADLYGVTGTPMAYLFDEYAVTMGARADGPAAILALTTPHPPAAAAGPAESATFVTQAGLAVGTPAPDLRLPRLDNTTLVLAAYRGRRVLLVFSDPACPPCERLAPELERLQRERLDLTVLMIGRGKAAPNRHLAARHGLTFPIALQTGWEVSRQFQMVGAQLACLLDERGRVASPVAIGADAILALAAGAP